MAYVPKDDEQQQSGMNVLAPGGSQSQIDEEKKNMQSNTGIGVQSSASPMPNTPAARAGQMNNQPTSGQSNAASAGGKGSGTFTNLQDYQKANQSGIQDMTGQIQKSQQQQAAKVGQAVQQQQSAFQRQVDENRQRLQDAQNFANQQISQAGQQPADESSIQRFQNLLNTPNQFNQATSDYSSLQNQIGSMENLAQNADRQDARLELLRRTFGGNEQYTSGQRALDDFLIAGNQDASRIAAEAPRRAIQQMQTQLADAKAADQAQLAQLQQDESTFRTGLQQGVDDAQAQLLADLEARKAEAEAAVGLGPEAREAIQSGVVSQDILDQLGLEDNRLYGVDVNDFLTAAPTLAGIASQEDLARAEALAGLEGTQQDIFTDPSQIGTFQEAQENQIQNLRDAVAERRAAYQQEAEAKEQLQRILTDERARNEFFRDIDPLSIERNQYKNNAIMSSNAADRARDIYYKLSDMGVNQKDIGNVIQSLAIYDPTNPNVHSGLFGNQLRDIAKIGLVGSGRSNNTDVLQNPEFQRRNQFFRQMAINDPMLGGTNLQYLPNALNYLANNVIGRDLAGIRGRYDFDNVLTAAKDGAVKNRLAALKKMLNE